LTDCAIADLRYHHAPITLVSSNRQTTAELLETLGQTRTNAEEVSFARRAGNSPNSPLFPIIYESDCNWTPCNCASHTTSEGQRRAPIKRNHDRLPIDSNRLWRGVRTFICDAWRCYDSPVAVEAESNRHLHMVARFAFRWRNPACAQGAKCFADCCDLGADLRVGFFSRGLRNGTRVIGFFSNSVLTIVNLRSCPIGYSISGMQGPRWNTLHTVGVQGCRLNTLHTPCQ
jgi:hypothetical protein